MKISDSLKADLLKVETWTKTVLVAAATGAMADVATVLHGGVGMLWQPGGVHTLVQVGAGGDGESTMAAWKYRVNP